MRYGAALVSQILLLAASANADPVRDPNDVVVQTNDLHHIGWDRGRLEVDAPNNPTDTLVVTFRGRRREALSALAVQVRGSSVDLTDAVKALAHPYVSRIALIVREWSATSTLFFVDLPYGSGSRTGNDFECDALQIKIVNGTVVGQTVHATPEGRCEF